MGSNCNGNNGFSAIQIKWAQQQWKVKKQLLPTSCQTIRQIRTAAMQCNQLHTCPLHQSSNRLHQLGSRGLVIPEQHRGHIRAFGSLSLSLDDQRCMQEGGAFIDFPGFLAGVENEALIGEGCSASLDDCLDIDSHLDQTELPLLKQVRSSRCKTVGAHLAIGHLQAKLASDPSHQQRSTTLTKRTCQQTLEQIQNERGQQKAWAMLQVAKTKQPSRV